MKLAIFAVLMMVAIAWAIPVADPEAKGPEEPKDLESSQPEDDLKTDSTFGFGYYRPYSYGGWGYRPVYRSWGGYGGGWGGYSGYGGYGYGGWGGHGGWGGRHYYW